MRALAAFVVGLSPALAHACAVCGAGEDDRSRGAYVTMTLIISGLPLLMLGGVIGYLFFKARAQARAELAAPAPKSP